MKSVLKVLGLALLTINLSQATTIASPDFVCDSAQDTKFDEDVSLYIEVYEEQGHVTVFLDKFVLELDLLGKVSSKKSFFGSNQAVLSFQKGFNKKARLTVLAEVSDKYSVMNLALKCEKAK